MTLQTCKPRNQVLAYLGQSEAGDTKSGVGEGVVVDALAEPACKGASLCHCIEQEVVSS
jgi:hypothetical protein